MPLTSFTLVSSDCKLREERIGRTIELAPVPMALFDNSSDTRKGKIKSNLKRELQVETLNRHTDQDNSLIVNGSVMLWKSPGL